jgi:U4/U6 small nuclear ribonucleoprotein PRP3
MGIDEKKILRPKRMSFQFVEEGKWTRDAENLKFKVCIVFCMDSF